MSDRPTKEQVETALLCAEMKNAARDVSIDDFYKMPDVLAAEVRALREEHQSMIDSLGIGADVDHGRDVIEACDALRQSIRVALDDLYNKNETLERVEALPAFWRDNYGTDYEMHKGDCANDLEAALKGGES